MVILVTANFCNIDNFNDFKHKLKLYQNEIVAFILLCGQVFQLKLKIGQN